MAVGKSSRDISRKQQLETASGNGSRKQQFEKAVVNSNRKYQVGNINDKNLLKTAVSNWS
jgi:hypothetical protein